ncbi:MAG: hypothetical protein LBF60_07505, partial [Treponema sp.]|nr:hypothetical protein [Treponema sp.]
FPPPPRRDKPGNPPRIRLSSAYSVPGRDTPREKSALKQAANPHCGSSLALGRAILQALR